LLDRTYRLIRCNSYLQRSGVRFIAGATK